ncbi:hypothetical protein TWF506_009181 [Arthrobotrys conoides]|uniref:Uncharacterized protein n=1 Tax=Arthrobotrys conoides TaxID=74498 RepID=A0AAN8NKG2_9PEZI
MNESVQYFLNFFSRNTPQVHDVDADEDAGTIKEIESQSAKQPFETPEIPPVTSQAPPEEQRVPTTQNQGQFLNVESLRLKQEQQRVFDSGYRTIPEETTFEERFIRRHCSPFPQELDVDEPHESDPWLNAVQTKLCLTSEQGTIPTRRSAMRMIDIGQYISGPNHSNCSSFVDEGIGESQPSSRVVSGRFDLPPDLVNGPKKYSKSLPEERSKKSKPEALPNSAFKPAPHWPYSHSSRRDDPAFSSVPIIDISDEELSLSDNDVELNNNNVEECDDDVELSDDDIELSDNDIELSDDDVEECDDDAEECDDDAEECDSREETVGEIRMLSAVIYFLLLRTYMQSSESALATPLLESSALTGQKSDNGDNCSDAADENNGGSSTEQPASGNGSTEESSGSAGQEHNSRPPKRKRGQTKKGSDEEDEPIDYKRVKETEFAIVMASFACPLAKADHKRHSGCLKISRQDLAGIKEHVRRKHFNDILPPKVRRSKTWVAVFRACNPDWGETPVPDPFVLTYFPKNQSAGARSGTFQDNLQPQRHQETASTPAQTISSPEDPVRESIEYPLFEGLDLSNLLPAFRNSLVANSPVGENSNAALLATMLVGEASRQISPLPSPEVCEEALVVVQSDLRGLPNLPPDEAYNQIQRSAGNIPFDVPIELSSEEQAFLEIQATDSSGAANFSYEMDNGNLVPSQFHASNSDFDFGVTLNPVMGIEDPYIPSSSAEEMLSLTQSPHVGDSVSPSQSVFANCHKQPNDAEFSLIVTRHPRTSKSRESSNAKDFKFHSYDDFEARFDSWMQKKFFEPKFSWETMEFKIPNPTYKDQITITKLKHLVVEIKVYHMENDTRTAFVHLVKKG